MVTYNILQFARPHSYYRGGGSGWWWVLGLVWHALFLALLIGGIVFLVRALSRRPMMGPLFGVPLQPVSSQPGASDPATSLMQAKALMDQGLITQVEYEGIRQAILTRLQGQAPS
jgi:hypothetical protein